MKIKTEAFVETAERELENKSTRAFLRFFPSALSSGRSRAMASFPDPDAALHYGSDIRKEAVERLPELLETFEKQAMTNGANVFWARDSGEANQYILNLAKQNDVSFVTKGKSMVTEEMGLNEYLVQNGIQAYETDLGEFIIQLLERPPFHIVGPALNIPVDEIRDIFMEKGVLKKPTLDPVELGLSARLFLRDKFHKMKMGITGINIAVAETGTIINVENEGNIRFNKSSPRIQVSIMSLEKVVPTMRDAAHLLKMLCKSATGQNLGAYVTFDTGPRKDDEIDGPEQLHIIILDNGRSRIYRDPKAREAFRCIRCGACLNHCPIYQQIGGYPYGWAYSGPMGQVLNPLLLGLEQTQDLFGSCTLCQACKIICPAGIDHPEMLLYYRAKNREKDSFLKGAGASFFDRMLYRTFAFIAIHPGSWQYASRSLLRFIPRIKNSKQMNHMPAMVKGWFQVRDLPDLPTKTFHDLWKDIK